MGPFWFGGRRVDFILTERHARIGEIEWAFWAATSFGLAFKNVRLKEKRKEALKEKKKKKKKERGAEQREQKKRGAEVERRLKQKRH